MVRLKNKTLKTTKSDTPAFIAAQTNHINANQTPNGILGGQYTVI
jgi:hypothetical protein